jgi:hypothetical protein
MGSGVPGPGLLRRNLSIAFAVALVLAACSSASDRSAGPTSSTTSEATLTASTTTLQAATPSTTDPCAIYRALRDARYLAEALAELNTHETCATTATEPSDLERDLGHALNLLQQANDASKNEDTRLARELLLQAAAIDAGNTDIRSTLDGLAAPAATTTSTIDLDNARRLRDAGFDTEARALTADAAKQGQTIPDELRETDHWYYLFEPAPGESPLTWLFKHLLPLVVVILIALVAFNLWRQRRDARRQLHFATGLTGDAEVMSLLIRDDMRRAGAGQWFSLVAAGGLDSFTAPKLGDIDSQLKVVDALISLFPISTSTVTPSVTGDPTGGGTRLGALEVINRRRPLSTVWPIHDVHDNLAEVQSAAAYATGWLILSATELLPGYDPPPADPGGTVDPESFGAIRAGVTALGAGQIAASRAYFHDALAKDPQHINATLNLAVAIAATGTERDLVYAFREFMRLINGV